MNYDVQELIVKGWRQWNGKPDKDGLVLLLCPFKDFDSLPNGIEMESIDGTKVIKGIDPIDTDTRVGLMAYGIRA